MKFSDEFRTIGLDFSEVDEVVRASVTLDDFSILSSSERELKQAGWVAADTLLAPSINIADFECVADMLDHPAYFIHYLMERARIQKSAHIWADELDYLGFYLDNGFNIWAVEEAKANLVLTGASEQVDKYYTSRDAGIKLPKPKPNVHPFVTKIIEGIMVRKPAGWIIMAIALLRIGDFKEQKAISNAVVKLRAIVQRKWRDPKHLCSIVVTPPAVRTTPMIFYVYPRALSDRRKMVLDELMGSLFETSGRARCLIVGKMLERWDEPYSFLGIAVNDAHSGVSISASG